MNTQTMTIETAIARGLVKIERALKADMTYTAPYVSLEARVLGPIVITGTPERQVGAGGGVGTETGSYGYVCGPTCVFAPDVVAALRAFASVASPEDVRKAQDSAVRLWTQSARAFSRDATIAKKHGRIAYEAESRKWAAEYRATLKAIRAIEA